MSFLRKLNIKIKRLNFGFEIEGNQVYRPFNYLVEGDFSQAAFFAVAVGNVPFGEIRVNDSRYNSRNLFIHDYFFEKTLDKKLIELLKQYILSYMNNQIHYLNKSI